MKYLLKLLIFKIFSISWSNTIRIIWVLQTNCSWLSTLLIMRLVNVQTQFKINFNPNHLNLKLKEWVHLLPRSLFGHLKKPHITLIFRSGHQLEFQITANWRNIINWLRTYKITVTLVKWCNRVRITECLVLQHHQLAQQQLDHGFFSIFFRLRNVSIIFFSRRVILNGSYSVIKCPKFNERIFINSTYFQV